MVAARVEVFAPDGHGPQFAPGLAVAQARLSMATAEQIAASEFGDGLLKRNIHAQYGSLTDNSYVRVTAHGRGVVGTVDAWDVAVSGLSIPRPCPIVSTLPACSTMSTLHVFVDDKSGAYIEAVSM